MKRRVLLIQCCHLPQFFFVLRNLERLHPNWDIRLFVSDHSQISFYLNHFAVADRAHILGKKGSGPESVDYDLILFPLLNRGYYKIKRAARNLKGERVWIGCDLNTFPLTRSRLLRSILFPQSQPTEDFVAYYHDFPHRQLGNRILIVESCHPSLVEKSRVTLSGCTPPAAQVTRIVDGKFLSNWRALRQEKFDNAVVYFSSEKGYVGLKFLPFVLRIPNILVFNESGDCFYSSKAALLRFLANRFRHGAIFSHNSPRILFFQTENVEYATRAIEKICQPALYDEADVTVICRESDEERFKALHRVSKTIPYSGKESWRSAIDILKRIRESNPDICCGVFSGRSVFRRQKLAFFLCGTRNKLVLNAQLDGYWLTPRTLTWIFRREALHFGAEGPQQRTTPVLLVQTEATEYITEAIKRIRDPKLYPSASILLLCREKERAYFRSVGGTDLILTYRHRQSFRSLLQTLIEISKFKAEVKVGVFSGRPVFRLAKLLYFLSRAKRRFAFNAALDGYWLNWRTINRIRRKEPLLFGLREYESTNVLLLETEEKQTMTQLAATIKQPHVCPGARITVFCHEDRKGHFESLLEVDSITTYSKQSLSGDLLQTWRLLRSRTDTVAAVFSGRKVFTKQKFLFWLMPVRNHLAFNQNLDCFYLNWSNIGDLIFTGRYSSLASAVTRFVLKMILFLPRFLFLICWLGLANLKRASRLGSSTEQN